MNKNFYYILVYLTFTYFFQYREGEIIQLGFSNDFFLALCCRNVIY